MSLRNTKNPIYVVWMNIMARAFNKNNPGYKYYGGVGITICKRWRDFDNFSDDVSPRPTGLTFYRIDKSKDFSPANCKWGTGEDMMHGAAHTILTTVDGIEASLAVHAKTHGLCNGTVIGRYKAGYRGADLVAENLIARLYTHDGKTQSIRAWERELGFKRDTIWSRIKRRGMSFEDAIIKPLYEREEEE